MKALIEKLKDGKTRVYAEIFSDPQEFMRINDSRDCIYDESDDALDPEYKGNSWNGVTTGADLREAFLGSICDASAIARVKSHMKAGRTCEQNRRRTYRSVCGYAPIVSRALMGLPDAMLNQRRESVPYKILDIYIDVTQGCGVSADRLASAGQGLIEEVIGLELAGYRVGITAVFSSDMTTRSGRHEIAIGGVRIKTPTQPLNMPRVIYPFVTPGFLRGVMFSWYQRCHDIAHVAGYGCAVGYGEHRDEVAGLIAGQHGIYLGIVDVIRGGRDLIRERLTSCGQEIRA